MKIKKGFIVRQIAGQNVAIAIGEMSKKFHGMIKLNDTGLFIWNLLQNDTTEEAIVDAVTAEYEVDVETAAADVRRILGALKDAGIIEEN